MTVVKLLIPLLVGNAHRPAGAIIVVGDDRAAAMIAAGHAEPSPEGRDRVANPEDDHADDSAVSDRVEPVPLARYTPGGPDA